MTYLTELLVASESAAGSTRNRRVSDNLNIVSIPILVVVVVVVVFIVLDRLQQQIHHIIQTGLWEAIVGFWVPKSSLGSGPRLGKLGHEYRRTGVTVAALLMVM